MKVCQIFSGLATLCWGVSTVCSVPGGDLHLIMASLSATMGSATSWMFASFIIRERGAS